MIVVKAIQEMGIRLMFAAGVAGMLLACASNPGLNEETDAEGVPAWVNEGSNIFTSKQGRRFHGVGSAPMLGNFSLQTSTAENRAKEEIARILASYIEIVSRDFIASGDAEAAGFTAQSVAQQMDRLSSVDLTGIQVIGHWQDKESKVVYAIAEADMQQVHDAITSSKLLDPGLLNFIKSEGNSIFDRIAHSED